jgi:sulfate/thiosulfate transport system ATP-binding protein
MSHETATTADISLEGVSRAFGDFQALSGVSLDVRHGELIALLGPSGSGKTTLLRIIAGLEQHDAGSVQIAGREATGLDVRSRGIGFVFQHYALFKHMTVADNIGFALRMQRAEKAKIAARVHELLSLFRLEGLAARFPDELSGGQRQRVALARALASEPEILLLDEPFGALDARVRQELRRWLRRLHDDIGVTTVFVTHDQEEALEVADRIVVMNAGRIEQVGTPEEVFGNPANEFVMTFIGNVNVFRARVHDGQACLGGMVVDVPDATEVDTKAYVRPHELEIELAASTEDAIPATVTYINPVGASVKVELRTTTNDTVFVELTRERYLELGLARDMAVFLRPTHFNVFAEDYSI